MDSYKSARASLQATLSPLDFAHVCSSIESQASKYKEFLWFSLHALFCHVCNRSLCIISVEAEMAEE